jgi:hypothetical protein
MSTDVLMVGTVAGSCDQHVQGSTMQTQGHMVLLACRSIAAVAGMVHSKLIFLYDENKRETGYMEYNIPDSFHGAAMNTKGADTTSPAVTGIVHSN